MQGVSDPGGRLRGGRTPEVLPPEMGVRLLSEAISRRSTNSVDGQTPSKNGFWRVHPKELSRTRNVRHRAQGFGDEESSGGSSRDTRRLHFRAVSGSQERLKNRKTSTQYESVNAVHIFTPFQVRRNKSHEGSNLQGGLGCTFRPQGRLFTLSPSETCPKVLSVPTPKGAVQMESLALRLSGFTKDISKVNDRSFDTAESSGSQTGNIPRRRSVISGFGGKMQGAPRCSSGKIDSLGLFGQSGKKHDHTKQNNRISRSQSVYQGAEISSTRRQVSFISEQAQTASKKDEEGQRADNVGVTICGRDTSSNERVCHGGSSASECYDTRPSQEPWVRERKDKSIRTDSRRYSMVDIKPTKLEWQEFDCSGARQDPRSGREQFGRRSSSPGRKARDNSLLLHQRPRPGTYQPEGVGDSGLCSPSICNKTQVEKHIGIDQDGQYCDNELHKSYGRKDTDFVQNHGTPTQVCIGKRNQSHSGVATRKGKFQGGQGQQDQGRLFGEETSPGGVQIDRTEVRQNGSRSVRNKPKPTSENICQQVGGPSSMVCGCVFSTFTNRPQHVCKSALHPAGAITGEDTKGESDGDSSFAGVEVTGVVAGGHSADEGGSTLPSEEKGSVHNPKGVGGVGGSEMGDSRLQVIRRELREKGYTESVFRMCIEKYKKPSDQKGTLRGYQRSWKGFVDYCRSKGRDAEVMEVTDVANFLSFLYDEGALGSKVDAVCTALDMTRRMLFPSKKFLADEPVIAAIRKTAKIRRPPLRDGKPKAYFDPALIFVVLRNMSPNSALGSGRLRQKAEVLMVLDAAARGSDLQNICMEHVRIETNILRIGAFWTKEMKQAGWQSLVFHCSCSLSRDTCTVCTVKEYMTRAMIVRRRNKAIKLKLEAPEGTTEGTPLLVSHRGKAAAVSIPTLRKDIASVMSQAGIDPSWTPHDVRGAVASKLWNLGAGEDRVLELGRWSARNTFLNHYFKKARYKETNARNAEVPLWKLLRTPVTELDE